MSVTVVGSIAFDTVHSPFGIRERIVGGAATHFALAASFFDAVRVVGSIGDDFGEGELGVLRTRGTVTDDVVRVPGGKTFFWHGEYGWDLNTRDSKETRLGVLESFRPELSPEARACDVLFLANITPRTQLEVLEQCRETRFVALDSMNLWIETAGEDLLEVIRRVDCLILNDAELRELTRQPSVAAAARQVLGWGPRAVVAKQGEYGASLFTPGGFFSLPGYPLERVVDPTGAGDTFAGGFVGWVATQRGVYPDDRHIRQAMAFGTALASFNVEDFGTDRVRRLSRAEIETRITELVEMTSPGDLATARWEDPSPSFALTRGRNS